MEQIALNKSQKINYYSVVHAFILLALVPFIIVIGEELKMIDVTDNDNMFDPIYVLTIPMSILSIYFYIKQKNSLKFKKIDIKCSENQYKETLKRLKRKLDIRTEINETNYFRGYADGGILDFVGYMITIVYKENEILFNSIRNPDIYSQGATFGRNKKNYRIFLMTLRDVLKGEPYQLIPTKHEKEWGIKRILTRLALYSFCVFLIIFGFYVIIYPTNWKSQSVGIGAITLSFYYLYNDIVGIVRDYKKKTMEKK